MFGTVDGFFFFFTLFLVSHHVCRVHAWMYAMSFERRMEIKASGHRCVCCLLYWMDKMPEYGYMTARLIFNTINQNSNSNWRNNNNSSDNKRQTNNHAYLQHKQQQQNKTKQNNEPETKFYCCVFDVFFYISLPSIITLLPSSSSSSTSSSTSLYTSRSENTIVTLCVLLNLQLSVYCLYAKGK